jgi:uncharacterized protein (DUF2252 family)
MISIPNPRQRADVLLATRNLKMARNAHAYVRGSTARFYEWLDEGAGRLPAGPSIWICGDCHLGNLGPLADADGHVDIQIRDLDQTVVGNPAHDLVRLGLSLASAARGSDLPGVTTARMLEEMIAGYEQALAHDVALAGKRAQPKLIRTILARATSRKWRHLAEERLEDVTPSIPLGKRYWSLTKSERKGLTKLFEADDVRELITSLRGRRGRDGIEVLDAAYWMKGCSSLGRLRYAVLVGVGRTGKKTQGSLCLIDIKEGVRATAPRAPDAKMPRDNAERVVAGARELSPNLGERMMAARLFEKSVILRELMPQDLKIEIDQLSREEAVTIARYLAGVVGRAHARQMDAAARRSWLAELGRHRSKKLDAPSWLWLSVVELIAAHEAAYLDHCRRFALAQAA